MDAHAKNVVNASQIRAARGLLDWSQEDLADATGLSIATIRKIESGHISPRGSTMDTIRSSLESAQIEFTPSSGLRLKDNDITTIEGNDAYVQLVDDVYHTMKDKSGEVLFINADPSAANEAEINAALRIKRTGIKWRYLCVEGNTHLHYPLEEYRWLPKKYYKRNIQLIYADKVGMGCEIDVATNTTTKMIIIKSAVLAESNRNLFNFLWENCRRPNFTTATKIYA